MDQTIGPGTQEFTSCLPHSNDRVTAVRHVPCMPDLSHVPPISSLTAPLSRRSFLAGALAFGGAAATGSTLLAACGSSSSSNSKKTGTQGGASGGTTSLTVQLVWLKNVQFGGSWIAEKQGLYDKFGVKPNLLAGGPNTVVEPIVVSGKALVGISNPDSVASAVAKGADLEIVATTYLKSPFMVMSLLDTPITSPQEMLGKKIGAPNNTGFEAYHQRSTKAARHALEALGIGYDAKSSKPGAFYDYPGDPLANGTGTRVTSNRPA